MSSNSTSLHGQLLVTIHSGRNLKDVQLIGKQDPYVEVSVDREKFKTKVHDDGGVTPVWNQSFIFNLDLNQSTSRQELIHFVVKDEDVVSDKTIGRCDIKIADLIKSGNSSAAAASPKWIQLMDVENFTKLVGQIQVTVEFKPAGSAAAAPVRAAVAPVPVPAVQVFQSTPQPQHQPQPQPIPAQVYHSQPQPQQQYQPQPILVQQQPQPRPVVNQPFQPFGRPGVVIQGGYSQQQPMMMQQPMMQQQQQQPMMMQQQQPQMMGMQQPMMMQQQQPMMMQQQQPMGMGMMPQQQQQPQYYNNPPPSYH